MNTMELYYQNETLFVEFESNLEMREYYRLKKKIFRIVEEYGVERIIIQSEGNFMKVQNFLREMKRDFYAKYSGDLLIR